MLWRKRYGWKFLNMRNREICSDYDRSPWTIGQWRTAKGWISTCSNGFHSSPRIPDAWGYVSGDVLALVEGAGRRSGYGDNKTAYQHMRIVRAWEMPADFAERRRVAFDGDMSPGAPDEELDEFFKDCEELKAPEVTE